MTPTIKKIQAEYKKAILSSQKLAKMNGGNDNE